MTGRPLRIGVLGASRIAELAIVSETLEHFYADVHAVVDELIYARNFYIALLSEDGETLQFPYSIDEHDSMRKSRKLTNGLTEYVLSTGKALLAEMLRRMEDTDAALEAQPRLPAVRP